MNFRMPTSRRQFVRLGTLGAAWATEQMAWLRHLPSVRAEEMQLPADAVRFSEDIEPLVRLLEQTPRAQVVTEFAERVRRGTSYREVLTALFLAGIRNVQPRPSVGFKFHAVLVVNSAHLASLAAPEAERWLPIFWALDYFKSSQARDVEEGDWTMRAVKESSIPAPHRAREAFQQAMEAWDVEAADAAVVGLCRAAGADEVFDILAHYGCRDFRSIGHKAIYVANGFRTLQCIGWRFAEPVLRSLTYALLNHTGEPNPAQSDLPADRAWRVTQEQIVDLEGKWQAGPADRAAVVDLLDVFRSGSPEEAVGAVAETLRQGGSTQTVSDALFLAAAEMLPQQPGIVSLHAATTTNALQYAFRTAFRPRTRLELLLQNAAFMPHFRQSMHGRGKVRNVRLEIEPSLEPMDREVQVAEIFDLMSQSRDEAALRTRRFLRGGGRAEELIDMARRLVFAKGNDAHDYKFSAAVLEDFYSVSPQYRDAYLGSATFLLPAAAAPDNGLVHQIQQALS
ncbi:MAG: hypothetical protein KatS3mg111_3908 [Pirellulaceae bacterium]|nr:MAG: hypothetical protein KatS3mg111_3908 [Pirellulaceae bacterium]